VNAMAKSGLNSTTGQLCGSDATQPHEWRQTSYVRFISSLPRLCSPTICGTVNHKTPDRKSWAAMTPLDQSFNWSIDQMAVLDPVDFSYTEDMDVYREIDDKLIGKQLDEENERFFAQKEIIPSPKTPKTPDRVDPRLNHNWSHGLSQVNEDNEENEENDESISMSGMEWQSIQSIHRTPQDQSLSSDCFHTPNNCSKSRQKKKLFVRDDHYLMESIDSAFETLSGQSCLSPIYSPDWRNTSLSKRISHLSPICPLKSNYIDLDFSFDIEDHS